MVTRYNEPVSIRGFPARPLIHPSESDGAWLTVYRSELKEFIDKQKQSLIKSRKPAAPPSLKLDKDFIFLTSNSNDPSAIENLNVSSASLTSVDESEDFLQFSFLAEIDATDNSLQLEDFTVFPYLTSLNLTLNNISRISPPDKPCFVKLRKLNLSYNNLRDSDLVHFLSGLPELVDLNLDGNAGFDWVLHFKPDAEKSCWFPKLEVLSLGENKISDSNVFNRLAIIKNLKILKLNNNQLREIPSIEKIEKVTRDFLSDQFEGNLCLNEEFLKLCVDQESIGFLSYTNLEVLDLSKNFIEDEESVLSLSLLPKINKIIFVGNPFEKLSSEHGTVADNFFISRNIQFIRKYTNIKITRQFKNIRKVRRNTYDLALESYKKHKRELTQQTISTLAYKYSQKNYIDKSVAQTVYKIIQKTENEITSPPKEDSKNQDSPKDAENPEGTTFATQLGEIYVPEDTKVNSKINPNPNKNKLRQLIQQSQFYENNTIEGMYKYAYYCSMKKKEEKEDMECTRATREFKVAPIFGENLKTVILSGKSKSATAIFSKFEQIYKNLKNRTIQY